jgi:hypothetical protein
MAVNVSMNPRVAGEIIAAIVMTLLTLLASSAVAAPVDDTPPLIDLTDSNGRILMNGTVFGSGNITILCLVQDDISEITQVEYSIDGSDFKPTAGTGGLHRTSIALTRLHEGNHTLFVSASNNASLSAEVSITFSVDTDSSTATADSPIWGVLCAIAGISGIALAVAAILIARKSGPKPSERARYPDELPPIM